jgi:hypothetical protein
MAGICSSGAGAAPVSPPPELPAAVGHGGDADHDADDKELNDDNDKFSPLVDLAERFLTSLRRR